MMNTINTELSFAEVWFTDQVSKPLEMGKLKEKTKKVEQIYIRPEKR